MEKTRIGIVGTGWRACFFLRVAKMLPELFEVVGIAYHSESSREKAAQWGYPLFDSYVKLAQEAKPDYMIVSVSRKGGAARGIVEELAQLEMPVLMETRFLQKVRYGPNSGGGAIPVPADDRGQNRGSAFRAVGQCLSEPVSAAQWVSFYQCASQDSGSRYGAAQGMGSAV